MAGHETRSHLRGSEGEERKGGGGGGGCHTPRVLCGKAAVLGCLTVCSGGLAGF